MVENLKCVGATVIEFRFFNQITKKKNQEEEEHCDFDIYEYLTHTASNYIQIFVGVNFYGDLHFDVN